MISFVIRSQLEASTQSAGMGSNTFHVIKNTLALYHSIGFKMCAYFHSLQEFRDVDFAFRWGLLARGRFLGCNIILNDFSPANQYCTSNFPCLIYYFGRFRPLYIFFIIIGHHFVIFIFILVVLGHHRFFWLWLLSAAILFSSILLWPFWVNISATVALFWRSNFVDILSGDFALHAVPNRFFYTNRSLLDMMEVLTSF